MVIKTDKDCRAYVEAELDHLVRSRAGWHAGRSVWVQAPPLSWTLGRDVGEGWYTLEARMDRAEFLIWFGNHDVGAAGIHWIVRPAVHVAFDDLWPRSDPLAIRSDRISRRMHPARIGDTLAEGYCVAQVPFAA